MADWRSTSILAVALGVAGDIDGGNDVKKLLVLAVAAVAALFAVRRSRAAKAEADLWREATAPTAN